MAFPIDSWLDGFDETAYPEQTPSPFEDAVVNFYENSDVEELSDQKYSDVEAWRDDMESASAPSVDEVIDYASSDGRGELDDEEYSAIEDWRDDVEDDYVEPYPPNDEDEDRYESDD